MTDQRANGNSLSQNEIDSPLTMGDLIAVLNSIFGQDISNRVMATATNSNGPAGDFRTAIKVDAYVDAQVLAKTAVVETQAQAPLAEVKAAANKDNGTQDNGTPPLVPAITETLPAAVTETQPVAVDVQVADTQPASALQADSTPATRWYAVTVGKEVGVFTDWNVVAPFVVSVSGACYPRYPSRQAAEAAFQRAVANGSVRRVV